MQGAAQRAVQGLAQGAVQGAAQGELWKNILLMPVAGYGHGWASPWPGQDRARAAAIEIKVLSLCWRKNWPEMLHRFRKLSPGSSGALWGPVGWLCVAHGQEAAAERRKSL